MSFQSLPFGFGLFVFGILAFNAYSEMVSAQCTPGQRGVTFIGTLSCSTCEFKCKLTGCPFQPFTYFCPGMPGVLTDGCLCCCGKAAPVPVPPSPPPPSPPPPPPPRNPNDLCLPTETSFTSTPPSGTCTPNTCPACSCPGGATPTLSGCTLNLCQCCCA
ncbi:hypothetical protein MKW92_017514 [Papaver armeniacum]|nr:hypothetical protein MKW92_017514 [Papaver armeniacum]